VGRAWWRGIAIVVAILLLAALGGPALGVGGDDEGEAQLPEGEGITYVGENTRQLEAGYLADKYGISLDGALARYDDREALDDAIRAIKVDGANQFTGVYFTKSHESTVLHIVRTDDHPDATVNLPHLQATDVVWETQKYSRQEMLETVQEILGTTAADDLTSASLDETTGTVLVTLRNGAAADALAQAYGDRVTTAIGEPLGLASCTSYTTCTPWRGGMKITSSGGSTACSMGFNAKWNNNNTLKMITAGHCGDATWTHVGQYGDVIGTTGKNCYSDLPVTCVHDTQRVGNADTYGQPRWCTIGDAFSNCYTTSNGSKDHDTATDNDETNQQGFVSGWDPAVDVNEADYFFLLPNSNRGAWFYGFVSGKARDHGDSGGPATWNNRVWGTATTTDFQTTNCDLSHCITVYSYADIAETNLNVTVCTTSGC